MPTYTSATMLGVTLLENITSGPTSKAAFGPEASSRLLLLKPHILKLRHLQKLAYER